MQWKATKVDCAPEAAQDVVVGGDIGLAYGLDRNTNRVSIFASGTVPPRQTAQDKTRSVESLLGR